jgi:hypothetical protein
VGDELGRAFVAPISRQVMAFSGDGLLPVFENESSASFSRRTSKLMFMESNWIVCGGYRQS